MSGMPASVAGAREQPVANPLFEYLLRLGDDRLVLGHRMSEWCGHGPILEEDIAMSNIALDLVGQASAAAQARGRDGGRGPGRGRARLFPRRAGVPQRAARRAARTATSRFTIVRQFLFDAYSVLQWEALAEVRVRAARGNRGEGAEGRRVSRAPQRRLGAPARRRHGGEPRARAGGAERAVAIHRRAVRVRRRGRGRARAGDRGRSRGDPVALGADGRAT